ncbi:MAG: putative hydro-lyase [Tissierellia bacterium]|nr:putative hydro-lyase [Tissierellia bacterium]MDD4725390.1 putative hydro-lyase [Tissierellia bacterium]
MNNYHDLSPKEVRKLIRDEVIKVPTAGMAGGYAQANLVILPKENADDFKSFAEKNPKPCPILEITEPGSFITKRVADNANIITDIPKYFIYKDGVKVDEVYNAEKYWRDDMVCFLIGCSFSFEEAMIRQGIDVRHISMGCNVPMYKTNIAAEPAGIFNGPFVVSMRPMKEEDVEKAYEITGKFPHVHGAPIHAGNPEDIGIKDINKPDYGDAVEIREGEVPVFWACGVTPQAAIENAKPEIVITHAPGHMFITDILNEEIEEKLF